MKNPAHRAAAVTLAIREAERSLRRDWLMLGFAGCRLTASAAISSCPSPKGRGACGARAHQICRAMLVN